jgi:hypothetical protein
MRIKNVSSNHNTNSSEENLPFPEIRDWLLSVPLYKKYKINDENVTTLKRLEEFKGVLDTYCVECGTMSVFGGFQLPTAADTEAGRRISDSINPVSAHYKVLRNRRFSVTLDCSREREHQLYFYFLVNDRFLTKIGQYPSAADISIPALKKYLKILGKEKHKEFIKGVGLFAHGVGIGSFVYLRRVFEWQIAEARQVACLQEGWDEEKFTQSRMEEKILLLKHELPAFLVENKAIYGIMSKGIHELSEEECLEYFPLIKSGIELILDQQIEALERKKKEAEIAAALNAIKSKI